MIIHTGYKLIIDSLLNGFIIIRNMHILNKECKNKFIIFYYLYDTK
jgi:hypothetical protein